MKQVILFILLFGSLVSSYTYAKKPYLISDKIQAKIEVLSWSPRIFIYRKFLSDFECDHLIRQAKPFLAPSKTVDNSRPHSVTLDRGRRSENMFFPQNHSDPIIADIEKRISLLTLIPPQNGEGIQVVHYEVGGEYKPHFDYFDANTVGGASHLKRGGQRVVSFLMYLNNPDEGGCTVFPKVGIEVKPIKGDALLFFDCQVDGVEDPLTLHGGAPVTRGEKWLATKWLHQYVFE